MKNRASTSETRLPTAKKARVGSRERKAKGVAQKPVARTSELARKQVAKVRRTRMVPRIFGIAVCSYAVLGLLTILFFPLRQELQAFCHIMDTVFLPLPGLSIAWTVALFLLGGALLAGKRAGWWIAVIFLTLFVITDYLVVFSSSTFDIPVEELPLLRLGTVVQTVLFVTLLIARPAFPARSRPGSLRQAFFVWLGGTTLVFLFGCILITLLPGTLTGMDRYGWVLNHAVTLSLFDPSQFNGRASRGDAFILSALSAIVIIAAVWTLLRSQQRVAAISQTDERIIRTMIARFNKEDSLAYFATRHDKAVVFAPNGRAAVTYSVFAGVSLASADPIGAEDSWDEAIAAWLKHSREYGWTPAVMGASDKGARFYKRHGLSALQLGDEAIIYPEKFHLGDPELRSVRQAVNRANRAGMTFRVRKHSELSEQEMELVKQRSDQWRDTTDERGFSMALSRLGNPADGDCTIIEALINGEVVAHLSFVPWGRNGLSLDLMRRAPGSPNGTIEAMVAHLCTNDRLSIQRISLNFAVFRKIFATETKVDTGPVVTFVRKTLVFFSRWWQMEALYRSNVKYNPVWVPRYMCFGESASILRTAIAGGMAEGFVPAPLRANAEQAQGETEKTIGGQAALALIPMWEEDIARGNQRRRSIGEQSQVRIDTARRLQDAGIDPWRQHPRPTHTCGEVANLAEHTEATISGRVMARRFFGGVLFLDIQDSTGVAQVIVERDHFTGAPTGSSLDTDATLGRNRLEQLESAVDLADLVRVTGVAGKSRKGHPSLLAHEVNLEAKSLHPLPDKRKGLQNPETRLRNRHLDMTLNPGVMQSLRTRSAVLNAMRSELVQRDYLEVETPILQPIHGGANARPFRTYINAYDMDLYLRIAPELYLKRLMCGGAPKVFELGRDFRNEGADNKHNPEFTVLEAYEAHGDYRTMMDLTRRLICAAATAVHGQPVIRDPRSGELVDISGEWPVRSVIGSINEALAQRALASTGQTSRTASHESDTEIAPCTTIGLDTDIDQLRKIAETVGVHPQAAWDEGKIIEEIYGELVEDTTTLPTFYIDFPASVSPLTRPHPDNPNLCQRWDLVAFGMELGTAYSELTDPLLQRERLEQQSLLAAGGDAEAMEVDEDFLRALEFGMPPAGGLGLGIDRIIMLINGGSMRENLAFPLVK
ncbi:bifunctional lysylphosphatidylglycerol synthetase/lysine--tRNA ligase LysX [Corynebacterium resistens]